MSEGMMKLLTWVTLVGLVAAHLGVDAFLSPLSRPASDTPGPSAIAGVGLSMGVMFAQPLLLAIVAVFWPARHMLRIGAALTLLILTLYALAHGQSRWSGSIYVNTITAPVVQFLISLIPFLILRRWRKWRIMAPATDRLGLDDGRFSVRALLVCMTIAGMLFALGHWILPPVRWPDAQSTWSKVWINSALVGTISTIALSPMFFCAPVVLGGELRKRRLFWAILGVLFVSVVLELLFAMSPAGGGAEGASLAAGLLSGAYGSVILSLLVVRWCGFRLVRAEDDGNTATGEVAHVNYTTGCSLSPPIGHQYLSRALYEWGTLAFGTFAAACLAYWVVSITSSIADLKPLEPRYGFVVSASSGSLAVRSDIDVTIKDLDSIATYSIVRGMNPPLASDHGLSVPGFRYRVLRFSGNDYGIWALEISLLIPFVIIGALAAACFYRFRAVREKAH